MENKHEIAIFEKLSFSEYQQLEGVNNSVLSALRRSPAHAYQAMQEDRKITPSMKFGQLLHMAVLEPTRFDSEVGVRPSGMDLRKKEDKTIYERMVIEFGEGNILKEEEYEAVKSMANSVKDHASASRILAELEVTEVSFQWSRPDGLLCKGRADGICPRLKTIVDIKTTEDASNNKDGFPKSVLNYGYYRQAAHYLDGLCALGKDYQRFVFIALEKVPPYACAVYQLGDESIKYGREELAGLYKTFKECQASNTWPGYSEEINFVHLPDWVFKK